MPSSKVYFQLLAVKFVLLYFGTLFKWGTKTFIMFQTTKYSMILGVFWHSSPGPTILKVEKALMIRLSRGC